MKVVKDDFKALELKLSETSVSPHTIYFKEHSVREHTNDKPSGRTLLVVNIPPYVGESSLKKAFSEAGTVEFIQFHLKPTTVESKIVNRFVKEINKPCFRVAYIVFNKVIELNKALKLTKLKLPNSPEHKIKAGVKKWIDEYNDTILQRKVLKESIETFMKKYDEESTKLEKKEKKLEQEDDEGWITVTKRGKVQSFARSEKVENKILEKEEKNKKRKELKNFYTFQIRESKMKHIVSLRQKFEEDKKKITHLKQSRRFKPF